MNKKGFSLIEMLVVIVLFAILATIASQSTVLSLRGARKSDSISDVRDNLDFAMNIIERSLRNAQVVNTCDTTPPKVTYIDEFDTTSSFSCEDLDGDTLLEVASGSARLTSQRVSITSCSFTCVTPVSAGPQYVDISFSGISAEAEGVDVSPITVDTRVNLRVY